MTESKVAFQKGFEQAFRDTFARLDYRDMDKIDGTPNPHRQTWIAHPTYDSYWQQQIAYAKDFAKIDIPVLQTAGYYYGGPGAAVYYLTEHYKHNPNAQHYLVIGPYDHFTAQRGTIDAFGERVDAIAGYPLDRSGRASRHGRSALRVVRLRPEYGSVSAATSPFIDMRS